MKAVLISSLVFGLAFGGYIDCPLYTLAECEQDIYCYTDSTINTCRANCTLISTFVGNPDVCNSVVGCIYDQSIVPEYWEGDLVCSFTPDTLTASPTTSAAPTTSSPTTGAPTTASPTEANETPSPTTTTDQPTTSAPTTGAPTTSSPTSRSNDGGGRCKADGTIQEQVFGPSEYQCGDHNLGQPEERCIYIDASSTCQGVNFMDCGGVSNPWPTFQSALDSLNGETVTLIVKAGLYTGEGNVNITSPNIHNLNEYVYLNIFSESGSDDTVIDCQGEGFGFHWFQTTIRMDGFTVKNCIAPKRTTFQLPTYADNQYIQSTPDTGRLGGAFFLDRTFITMNDMIIVNNQAEFGGGIFQYQNSIRMNNSIVEYNCATNSGGGIFLLFANIYMWNSYVICNSADVFGGGIFGHQQRTDINEKALVDENTAEYADELFCDRTTVNVFPEVDGKIADNDVDSWGMNEITYCCCNNCAFYSYDSNNQRVKDYCSRSDNSLIDYVKLDSLKDDQGECVTNDATSAAPTATKMPTNAGDTFEPTEAPTPQGSVRTNDANGYKVFAVMIVTMVISFISF